MKNILPLLESLTDDVKMTAMSEDIFNLCLKDRGKLSFRMTVAVHKKIVCIKFRDGFDSANFAEIMKKSVRYFFKCKFGPVIQLFIGLLPFLVEPIRNKQLLFLALGYLRKHLFLCYNYTNHIYHSYPFEL